MGHPVANDPKAMPDTESFFIKDGRTLTILGMKPADIPRLASIYCEAYADNSAGEQWTPQAAEGLLNDLYSANPALSLVADIDGVTVGATISETRNWESGKVIMEVKEFFVKPDFQKLGIGNELLLLNLHRAEQWRGVTEVELITFTDEGSQRYYERSGLEPVHDLQIMAGEGHIHREKLEERSTVSRK
jgi:GNAT superfamily N-acetyltransferase